MPVKPLPPNPSLAHLKYQAKDLMKDRAAYDRQAAQRIREFHPKFCSADDQEVFGARFSLSDAQITIAREHGFASWTRLKRRVEEPVASDQLNLPHHERIEDARFRRAVSLLDAGDTSGLRTYLLQYPELVQEHVLFEGGNYFRNPTLLEFVAENPVRHGKLPENIVQIAGIIIDAGAKPVSLNAALMLVSTGMVPRQCGVQAPLIDLLCDHGGDPNRAILAAVLEGEFEAVNTLIRRGATVSLPVAAALGRTAKVKQLVGRGNENDTQLALTLAAMNGHTEIVSVLLDDGADPNRYNPIGAHSHSTPLHQAAYAGHEGVVRFLVKRGARLDIKDILWNGTPAEWAHHAGKGEIESYLRTEEAKKNSV